MEFEEIVKFKDVIKIKQFYWEQEKLYETTKKRKCLLTHGLTNNPDFICQLELSVSEDFSKYCDKYVFGIDYKNEYGRVNFHGWSITNAPIKLISYKHITANEI